MDAFSHQRRDGAVDDGMGRMSGKGQRMITVHAITNYGLVVVERVHMNSLYPRCVFFARCVRGKDKEANQQAGELG